MFTNASKINENPFEKIEKAHLALRRKQSNVNLQKDILKESQDLLRRIRLAAKQIVDRNQRNQLEFYAEYWGLFIYEITNQYPETSLLEFGTKVFNEDFRLEEVYIPLYVAPEKTSNSHLEEKPKTWEEWITEKLELKSHRDQQKDKKRKPPPYQVLIIKGQAGTGKSTFCHWLTDRLWQDLERQYTPVLIDLQDIKSLEFDFLDTLRKNLTGRNFAQNNPKTPRLFLLDDLSNLVIENYPNKSREDFLKQIVNFSLNCIMENGEERRDRVLITSRPFILEQILAQPEIKQQFLPYLDVLEIQPMNEDSQTQWINTKWQRIVGTNEAEKFKAFLENVECQKVKKLAKEPLLLYLLAAMYRDDMLKEEELNEISDEVALIVIFNKILDWVIEKQLPHWIANKILDTETESKDQRTTDKNKFKRILAEAGLCAMQSGGISTTMKLLNDRLINQGNPLAEKLIEHRRKEKDPDHKNILAKIFYEPTRETGGYVEFNHRTFCEFLYAKRLVDSLADWTKKWDDFEEKNLKGENHQPHNRNEFVIPLEQMDWEIYDLLGFGRLTPEIVEYLQAYLEKWKQDFGAKSVEKFLKRLFQRLQNFYYRWFKEDFINKEYSQTLAQRKMIQLQKPLEAWGLFLGRRQINIYAGLNVLILLLEIHRKRLKWHGHSSNSQKSPNFYASGKPFCYLSDDRCCHQEDTDSPTADTQPDPSRILRLISYCRWLSPDLFVNTVGPFLKGINLRGADLRGAELYGINLTGAYLSGANLNGINLSSAKLNQAFLSSTRLCRADLNHAELKGAFLGNADLTGAYLANADLQKAVLTGANLCTALLVNANLDMTYFGDADLSDAILNNATLEKANLSCARLQDVNLKGAKLKGAILSIADLKGANLTNTNFRGANLANANLTDANLTSADIRGTDFHNADLTNANFKDVKADKTTNVTREALDKAQNVAESLWDIAL